MNLRGIYAITDDTLLANRNITASIEAALQAGISMLQYRTKLELNGRQLEQVCQILDLCRQHSIPLIINDDVTLCKAIGAQGVHLGDEDENLRGARITLGAEAIIGVTCHDSLQAAVAAEKAGADYVAFGRFHPSKTKPEAPSANINILREAQATLSLPIVAIGGINVENGAALIEAGADMLAVIHAIFGTNEISARTQRLVDLFEA